jgi:hypothetical protein
MKLHIEIDMDNAAFEDDPQGEAERIVARFFAKWPPVRLSSINVNLRDINGNACGRAWTTED